MMEAIFRVDGNHIETRSHAGGPWDPTMQHGGAASSLAVWLAERLEPRVPMQIARVTVDLLRPVPVAPLTFESEVVREGRKIQLCAVKLLSKGTEVMRASVLKLRREAIALPADAAALAEEALDVKLPEDCEGPDDIVQHRVPFLNCLLTRGARGSFGTPGPASVWYRADRPVVEGHPISPVMRAAIAGDFCNGVSSVLDFNAWTFINGDLTLNLAREPIGEWILLDAKTWIGPEGAAIAFARLGDRSGYFGRAIQSVLIEPRT